jgi:hypothetical protein
MGICFHLGRYLLIFSEAKNVSNKTEIKMKHTFYLLYTLSVVLAICEIIKQTCAMCMLSNLYITMVLRTKKTITEIFLVYDT